MAKTLIERYGWTARKHWYAKEDKFQWVMSHDPHVAPGKCRAHNVRLDGEWRELPASQIAACGATIDSYPPGYEPQSCPQKINSQTNSHGPHNGYVGKLVGTVNGKSYDLYSDPQVRTGTVLAQNPDGSYSSRKLSEFVMEHKHPLLEMVDLPPPVTPAGKLWEYKLDQLEKALMADLGNTDENMAEWMRDQYDREHHDQLDTPRPRVCDCGGEKTGTTHSTWCSTQGGDR